MKRTQKRCKADGLPLDPIELARLWNNVHPKMRVEVDSSGLTQLRSKKGEKNKDNASERGKVVKK